MIYKPLKRILDFFFAVFLIILLIPLFLLISLLISLTMGFPILFFQERTGLSNRPFKIVKFRTMRNKDEKFTTDEKRITWIGKILRLFRLDELPQLFNICKGDMSFIGPRPLLTYYLPYYTSEEIRRHEVRPGLSGLGQISNLNYPRWEEQFEYDVFYVDNICFSLDFKIFWKTIGKIFRPNVMAKTGVAGGRMSFDAYRISLRDQED